MLKAIFLAPDGRLRPSWRFWLAVVVFIAANIAGSLAARLLQAFHPELVYRLFTTLFMLAGFSGMLYVLDRERGPLLAAMGLGLPWLRQSLVGTALGAAMVALAVGAIAALGSVQFRWIGGGSTAVALLGSLALQLVVLAVAAMLEEAAFRGYPFQRLVEGVGPVCALLILNGLFGAVHLGNPHASLWGFLNTVAVGVVLGMAYLRTRALWLPWGIHFGWNAMLGVAFGLPVSGTLQFRTLVAGSAEGPLWLTGGGYGIEASATGGVVILIGLAGVLALTPRQPALTPALPEAIAPASEPPPIPPL
ncbi:MAG: CPBP family intramembrane metalloprotease [Acidobacteria bacterium]|nr:CPBP family intramembrane metalloprotease [Acidobacteriota bacterium]